MSNLKGQARKPDLRVLDNAVRPPDRDRNGGQQWVGFQLEGHGGEGRERKTCAFNNDVARYRSGVLQTWIRSQAKHNAIACEMASLGGRDIQTFGQNCGELEAASTLIPPMLKVAHTSGGLPCVQSQTSQKARYLRHPDGEEDQKKI